MIILFCSHGTVPPEVKAAQTFVIAVIRKDVYLQFLLENADPPVLPQDIQWMFAGVELQEDREHVMFSSDRLSVTITNLSLSDEGVYSLTATNPAGSDSDTIIVDVQGIFDY